MISAACGHRVDLFLKAGVLKFENISHIGHISKTQVGHTIPLK